MRHGTPMPGPVPHPQGASASPLPALRRPWQGLSSCVSIQTQHGNSGMMPAGQGDVRIKDGLKKVVVFLPSLFLFNSKYKKKTRKRIKLRPGLWPAGRQERAQQFSCLCR